MVALACSGRAGYTLPSTLALYVENTTDEIISKNNVLRNNLRFLLPTLQSDDIVVSPNPGASKTVTNTSHILDRRSISLAPNRQWPHGVETQFFDPRTPSSQLGRPSMRPLGGLIAATEQQRLPRRWGGRLRSYQESLPHPFTTNTYALYPLRPLLCLVILNLTLPR
jgi:hypothetical protein